MVGHEYEVGNLMLMPDGRRVLSASTDGVKVWDVETGRELLVLADEVPGIFGVLDIAVTPDGQRLVVASDNQTLTMWDLTSGKAIARFTGDSSLFCCAIGPDGETVVTGERSGAVHFLRLQGSAEGRQ